MCIKTLYEKWNQKKKDWDRIQCLLRKLALAHKQLRMYKEFWDNVSEATLLVRIEDGQILDANPAACSLYGYSKEDILKITMKSLTVDPKSTRNVANEKMEYVPLRYHLNHDGTTIPITATITYFNDEGIDVAACIIRPLHTYDGVDRRHESV